MNALPAHAAASAGEFVRRAVEDYEGMLRGYTAGITGDPDSARDVVQDTFLKLCAQDPALLQGAGLKAWLFTVCRNRALDLLRRRRRLVSLEEESLDHLISPEPCPAEQAAEAEETAAVLRLFHRLPANQAEVLRLKFLHDLSYKEIAAATGLSQGNVGFLLHTGLRRLRALLPNETGANPFFPAKSI